MFRRILRSTTLLAALVVAYQAYVLLAVPLMEPPLEIRQARTKPRPPGDVNPATTYQLLLSNYFPKDHWSQTRPPKVIASSNEQAMLVLDDYKRHEDGRVDIERFALLIFPTPPREGITPPRDTIILEAPQGARLQFNDFRPERGQIGQITRGQFPGRITIRSDMHEPGPQDDLIVETADLEMNTKLLYSNHPVRFRLGQNVGGGRELEIRFLAEEHLQPHDSGLKIAGIESLEIRRDVRMRLQLETDSLLPSDEKKKAEPSPNPSLKGRGNSDAKPVEVTCSGPFTFDFVRYVASLDRDVELRQLNPNGPSDQMSCGQLDIHFVARLAPGETQPVVVDPGKRQQRDLGRLEPAAIVAAGHPVIVISPAREGREMGAQARGDKIQIALREQRVRISGGNDAMFVYGPNVLRAPQIDYQHPARDTETTIGRFRATGPGSLRYLADPAKQDQVFQAAWQTSIELGRENGQPILTLDGRPQLAYANAGSFTADKMKVYLRELENSSSTSVGLPIAGGKKGSKLQVTPDRLIATGRIEVRNAQLTGRTGELLVSFHIQPPTAADKPADSNGGLANQLNSQPGAAGQQSFIVDADKMRVDVNLHGESASPSTLVCDGNVLFREVPLAATNEQPLEISGEQLTVDRLDTKPFLTLHGTAPGQPAGSKRAQLAGRGVTLLVDKVEMDGRENRMWSDGPGKATLLVTRDLAGQASATPFPLEITWQGGLQFDGRTIVFGRDVIVAGTDDSLHCDRLTGRLSAPIDFAKGIDQRAIDLAQIECDGNVLINHLSRDAQGVTSHERMRLARLSVNQQTGEISGVGPGTIRSTRFGNALAALAVRPGAAPQPIAPPADNSKLHFLRVDFQRGLAGNMYTRELTFYQQVRAVYGPVDAWEQEWDIHRPELLPPEAVTLACDEMRINEDPIAARAVANPADGTSRPLGPAQLQATGNVQIEGQVPGQGAFRAQAQRATYEQEKDVFMLKGDGRNPARLWRQGQTGTPPAVDWIRYVRKTGDISVGGIQYLEITPDDIENARRQQQQQVK